MNWKSATAGAITAAEVIKNVATGGADLASQQGEYRAVQAEQQMKQASSAERQAANTQPRNGAEIRRP